MSDFIKAKSRRRLQASIDPESTDADSVEALCNSLASKLEAVRSSSLCVHVIDTLKTHSLTKVRCLALGSPSQEEAALYQLAMLKILVDEFKITPSEVSLHDPVFSPLDKAYFESIKFKVEEVYESSEDANNVLYFLPHAPLSLTNTILDSDKPTLLLANNIVRHTERMTKSELFEKYPLMSKLVNELDATAQKTEDDGFQVVTKKKNRKQKNKFIEPKIDYQSVESYFKGASLTSYRDYEEGPWLNAFTDLAFHALE